MGILNKLFGKKEKESELSDDIQKTMETEPISPHGDNDFGNEEIVQNLDNVPNGDKVVRNSLGMFTKKE